MPNSHLCLCGNTDILREKIEYGERFNCKICGRISEYDCRSGMLCPIDIKSNEDSDAYRDFVHYDHSKFELDKYGFLKRPLPRYTEEELKAKIDEHEAETAKWREPPYYD